MKLSDLKCEVCGEPATNAVHDIEETSKPLDLYKTFKPYGSPHFYCDKHNRSPKTYQGDKALDELLQIIKGEGRWAIIGKGITTYPNRDKGNQKIHDGCLELELRGVIERHLVEENYIVWKPIEGMRERMK